MGGEQSEQAVRALGWCGRLLVVGFAAGRIPSLPANLALLKSCDVRGVFYGAWRGREPAEARKNFDEMLAWYGEGKLKPHISMRLPLEKAADAMNDLLSRNRKLELHFAGLSYLTPGQVRYRYRLEGFDADATGEWELPGPFEKRRLLARAVNGHDLPAGAGMIGPR